MFISVRTIAVDYSSFISVFILIRVIVYIRGDSCLCFPIGKIVLFSVLGHVFHCAGPCLCPFSRLFEVLCFGTAKSAHLLCKNRPIVTKVTFL